MPKPSYQLPEGYDPRYRPRDPQDFRVFPFRMHRGVLQQYSYRRHCWEPARTYLRSKYYFVVWLPEYGVMRSTGVHRVIWMLHHGPIPSGLDVDHIDNNKTNNHISNLQLLTHGDNMRKAVLQNDSWGPTRKLLPHRKALVEILPRTCSLQGLAERWGVSYKYLRVVRNAARLRGVQKLVGRSMYREDYFQYPDDMVLFA